MTLQFGHPNRRCMYGRTTSTKNCCIDIPLQVHSPRTRNIPSFPSWRNTAAGVRPKSHPMCSGSPRMNGSLCFTWMSQFHSW